MLKPDGESDLKEFSAASYQEAITEITPHIWHVLGVGHSNSIFIEGDTSVVVIDTLDTLERGKKLLSIIRSKTDKPVKTIIYTHFHPDHRGGAGAFTESAPEIIAFAPAVPPLGKTAMIQEELNKRGARQFGYALSDEETISQGIGIREGFVYGETKAFVPPSTVYNESEIQRNIDGITLSMVRLPGETDDQIMIWIPDERVLCCGDNYYGCWPNLYAIRGSQYRDIAGWVKSLDTILTYPAKHLLPGHTRPLSGEENIKEVLGNFRNAINYVLDATLTGMNEGKDMDTLAAGIRLPEQYAGLPYLGEYYGCVEWTVRAIYTGYAGWFDGNPVKLHPLSPAERADKTIILMGGAQAVLSAVRDALKEQEFQWCLELCDLLEKSGQASDFTRKSQITALRKLAALETSANGRHYYLCSAYELENKL